jgi:hypothetical protein
LGAFVRSRSARKAIASALRMVGSAHRLAFALIVVTKNLSVASIPNITLSLIIQI